MRCAAFLLLSGLSIACTAPGPGLAQTPNLARPSARGPFGDLVAEAAQRFALPAAWIRAVMKAESAGDPRATSLKGAMGLMQIMPDTWAGLRLRHRLGSDPYDPHDNIIAGAAYIRALFDRYGSPGWIAAYNAGPGRYEASLSGRPLPAETRAYVATVAPNLNGDEATGPVMVTTADPLAWTHAALFVARSDRSPTIVRTPSQRPSNDASAAAPSTAAVRDISAIVPQSGSLFIARTGAGERP